MPESTVAPLAVLSEDWPLRDVLLLTFNCNLGFFERAALARVRARGARVTVVSDADMVHADAYAVRFAGRSYLDGRAACASGGAFHPKLIVTVGEDRAAVLIGSGNVSPGGWIDNAELWTSLRASADDGAPQTLHQVADFLDALPAHVRFTPGVVDVMTEISDTLRAFTVTTPGPLLVSSVFGPIIDQVPPAGPVERLVVATPFHDRAAEATRRLHARLEPSALEVLHQKQTLFDGERLTALLDEVGGTVASIAERRYHHGKLIEWSGGGTITSLTGSPNASRAALLLSISQPGGNCELGLIAATGASLRPETGDTEPPATVADRVWEDPPEDSGGAAAQLLAVVLEPGGLRVLLRKALDAPAKLQHIADGHWKHLDDIAAGVAEHISEFRLPGASALRLLHGDGSASNVVWVADLVRTSFRSVAARRSLPNDPVQMALDPHLVTMVEQALATVRAWSAETVGPGTVPMQTAAAETPAKESWRDFIDAFRSEVGDDFSFFVLPHLMRAAGAEPTQPTAGKAVGEEVEDPEAVPEDTELIEMITARLEAFRRSERNAERLRTYRRMCEKLNDPAGNRPHPVRIAAITLTVGGAALGCWHDKTELGTQLRRSIRQLKVVVQDPDLCVDAANIAAVALAVMRAQVRSLTSDDEITLTYRLAAREARPLLANATADGITERAAGLVAVAFGPAVTTTRVLSVIADVTAPEHIATAAELLAVEHGMPAEVEDTCIRITGIVRGDPGNAVLRAIGLAQDAPVVGAVARSATDTAAGAWRSPHVVLVRRTPKTRRVTHYKLTTTLRPSDYLRTDGRIPTQFEQDNWYGDAVPAFVEELLLDAGIFLEDI